MLDWSIEMEQLALYEGKLQVRNLDGLGFSCNPKRPDGWFCECRRGEYGLYVEGKGWMAWDENSYIATGYSKEQAQKIASTKGIHPSHKVYFARSWNEPIAFAGYNMMKIGYQQLLEPVEVVLNSYAYKQEGQTMLVDALEYDVWLKEPVVALCGSIKLSYYKLTIESKIRLGEELERTLKHYNYPFTRVSWGQFKRAHDKDYKAEQAEWLKSKEKNKTTKNK